MAIIWCADNHSRIVKIHERVKFLRFLLGDKIELKANILRTAFQVTEPILFKLGEGYEPAC